MFQRPEDRMTAVAAAERLRAKAVADHRLQSAVTSRLVVAFCARAILCISFVCDLIDLCPYTRNPNVLRCGCGCRCRCRLIS